MKLYISLLFILTFISAISQDITISFELITPSKVPHKNIKVRVENAVTLEKYFGISNNKGIALVNLPEGGNYNITLDNSQRVRKVPVPNRSGIKLKITYKYKGGEDDWSKKYPPSPKQIKEWDLKFKKYPKTTITKVKSEPANYDARLVFFNIKLFNIKKGALIGETVYVKAKKYKKTFVGKTDKRGNVFFLLPKGDEYDVSFKYDKNYELVIVPLTAGKSRKGLELTYLGSKEIERRKREKERKIKEEEKRLAKREAEFKKYLKESKKRAEEVIKERMLAMSKKSTNSLINKVFKRNKWKNKLVVCDLTGSMNPYAAQLSSWYTLNYMVNKNMQFVFFNDGDKKQNNEKKIGETGGIYYSKNLSIDGLIKQMAMVQANGSGGDCPENNMEALIKGTKQAKPYTELIMIVDNNAPVKDIELLKKFNKPVHIILCGVNSIVEEDYLQIAYKTKGSVHTIEKDLKDLWKMAEGRKIKINGYEYMLLKGKFIAIRKS